MPVELGKGLEHKSGEEKLTKLVVFDLEDTQGRPSHALNYLTIPMFNIVDFDLRHGALKMLSSWSVVGVVEGITPILLLPKEQHLRKEQVKSNLDQTVPALTTAFISHECEQCPDLSCWDSSASF
ncbi:hypothetical protein BTVI_69984 [Pitangus sulphuratus]|nr:hypothetical protein BTVI_69984 [Pitangus sulphuratus]